MTGRISDMDAAGAVTDADLFESVQGGSNVKQTAAALKTYMGGLSNPMDAAGDIIIGGADGVPERLEVGTAGQVLTVVDGAPAWEAPSAASTALNRQAGNYTVQASDAGGPPIASTDASASTITFPGYGSGAGEVEWADGATVIGLVTGAGQVTFAVSGGSTTIECAHGTLTSYGQYAFWFAVYDATVDQWVVGGDLT